MNQFFVVEKYGRFYPARRKTFLLGLVQTLEFYQDEKSFSSDPYSGHEGYDEVSFSTQQEAVQFFPPGTNPAFLTMPEREEIGNHEWLG